LVGLIAAASIAAALEPPPFGTVLGQWDLPMSGPYAGAGITWRRDSGLFYLMDQNRSVWKLDPTDSTAAIRRDSWVFANLGDGTQDIPWGIAWDPDSGCYWVSQIIDGNVYAGCYLLRIVWSGGAWCWGGTPADSWKVSNTIMYWVAGMAKRTEGGYFIGAAVSQSGGLVKFDPYTKVVLGSIGPELSCRCVALVPADSYYIITHDTISLMKLDSAGQLLQRGDSGRLGQADLDLAIPAVPDPDDTVSFYAICSNSTNTLQGVSAGMLWGQLKAGQAIAEPAPPTAKPAGFSIEPNPCRGSATIHLAPTLTVPCSITLMDVTGRTLQSSHHNPQPGMRLDLRALRPGVYIVRIDAGTVTCSEKLILQH
jgi:hypothetical protein